MNETTIEPMQNAETEPLPPGLAATLANLQHALRDFRDGLQEVEEAGLTPLFNNLSGDDMTGLSDRIESLKAGILTAEPMPPDAADALVKGFAGVLSAAECRQAVRENPQPEITEPDPLKARIIGMMTENTGCDILDSGGVHGRQWQRNRHIKDWDSIPACEVEVCADGRDDGEVVISYNIYPYLCLFLDINEESERLNAMLQDIVENSGNKSYPADVEEFLKAVDADNDGYACGSANTYNYDNILAGILQYDIFEVGGETYIALQIHGGMDARAGYTKPQVFTLNEPDYFIMAQSDISAWCGCGDWNSDDAGYNWYFEGCSPSKPADWFYNREDNTVRCLDCRQPVRFGVTDSI